MINLETKMYFSTEANEIYEIVKIVSWENMNTTNGIKYSIKARYVGNIHKIEESSELEDWTLFRENDEEIGKKYLELLNKMIEFEKEYQEWCSI